MLVMVGLPAMRITICSTDVRDKTVDVLEVVEVLEVVQVVVVVVVLVVVAEVVRRIATPLLIGADKHAVGAG